MVNSATTLVSCEDYESKLISAMRNLYSNKMLTDVTLSCDNQIIQAHRTILASASPYFLMLFQSPLLSGQPGSVVVFKEMQFSHLKAVIDFIYTGELRVSEDQVDDVIKAAEILEVSGIKASSNIALPKSPSNNTTQPARKGLLRNPSKTTVSKTVKFKDEVLFKCNETVHFGRLNHQVSANLGDKTVEKDQNNSKSGSVVEEPKSDSNDAKSPYGKLITVDKEETYPLVSDFLIGRDRDVGFRINKPEVSRQHCLITHDEKSGNTKLVEKNDVDKNNGDFPHTLVNGDMVEKEAILKTGDIIEVAGVKLKFESDNSESTSALLYAPETAPPRKNRRAATKNVAPESPRDSPSPPKKVRAKRGGKKEIETK